MTSIRRETRDQIMARKGQHLELKKADADAEYKSSCLFKNTREEEEDDAAVVRWATSTAATSDSTATTDEEEILSRPILVGYAFGPKKMSTMGVVMAEASKANLSSVKTTVLVEEAVEDETADDDDDDDDEAIHHHNNNSNSEERYDIVCHGEDDDDDENDHHSPFADNDDQGCCHHHQSSRQLIADYPKVVAFSGDITKQTPSATSAAASSAMPPRSPPSRRVIPDIVSLDYNGGLKNIVRYLHSSCSSVDTNSTSTTLLTTGTTLTAVTPSSASTCGGGGGKFGGGASVSGRDDASGNPQQQQHQQRLRVNFVPLDPDLPLEGQHGAEMDIILHKLTEDILCLSKFSHQYPTLVKSLGQLNSAVERMLEELQPRLPRDAQAAILRVHRLMQYHKKHPECSLADDPSKVLTLMSRSDIAHALADCLVGVRSASGIPVASPKFVVWEPKSEEQSMEEQTKCIAKLLKDANMSYPLIAKPLQAAGTKISHHMTVLLNESSLEHIHGTSCLLQEYANHDAVLYKVYVLGNNVRVYQRPSLPNLPPLSSINGGACRDGDKNCDDHTRFKSPSYVDFDSQRPYPRLSAFGVVEGKRHHERLPPPYLSSLGAAISSSASSTSSLSHPSVGVTTEEVQPLVDTLKEAFGLELFGFDILITSSQTNTVDDNDSDDSKKRRMLVVDVNYFPSYKEVSNFPSLLAQYLTQQAIDSRRQKQHRSREKRLDT